MAMPAQLGALPTQGQGERMTPVGAPVDNVAGQFAGMGGPRAVGGPVMRAPGFGGPMMPGGPGGPGMQPGGPGGSGPVPDPSMMRPAMPAQNFMRQRMMGTA